MQWYISILFCYVVFHTGIIMRYFYAILYFYTILLSCISHWYYHEVFLCNGIFLYFGVCLDIWYMYYGYITNVGFLLR